MPYLLKIEFVILFITLTFAPVFSFGQSDYLPLNRYSNNKIESNIDLDDNFHTSIKPFFLPEVKSSFEIDSMYSILTTKRHNKIIDVVLNHHFAKVDTGIFRLYVDPLFDFQPGYDLYDNKKVFINTRGVLINSNISEKFSVSSSLLETQASFISYQDSFIRTNLVVPGQGRIKSFGKGYDYNLGSAHISYSLDKHFNFQFGHDKNFIGDGYRSLLLSDNAINYPFFKISTNIWKLKYVNIFAAMQNLQISNQGDKLFPRKYIAAHYLSWNIVRRLNIGFFEAIISAGQDALGRRSFDINYLNPVIFYRSVEGVIGSNDNALMGLNLKYKFLKKSYIYGQLLADEILLEEIKAQNGWWANKHAFQLGVKFFDLFKIDNLYFQTEYCYVRPYTYSHRDNLQSYGNLNQPLAHPLGANFYESVTILSYYYKRWYFEVKLNYAAYGGDTLTSNYGKNVFLSNDSRENNYGNFVAQGLKTNLMYREFFVSYLINPQINMLIQLSISNRIQIDEVSKQQSNFIYLSFKTSLFNYYYDF